MRVWLLTVGALLAVACTSPPQRLDRGGLTIYGAASLRIALETLKPAWEAKHPEASLTISTGSSAALRAQIELGAPADVFLAADAANPRTLADAGLAEGGLVAIVGNALAIVTPADNPGRIAALADLARPGLKVIAARPDVPISGYVQKLLGRPGLPPGFAAAYAANIVSREDDVAAVLAKIELGEGDAGIVYRTDASASSTVDTIPIPAAMNVRATYAGVVMKASRDRAAAHAFLDWIAGPDARAVLESLGFAAPDPLPGPS